MDRYSLRDYRMSSGPGLACARSGWVGRPSERKTSWLRTQTEASAHQHLCGDRKTNPAVADVATVDEAPHLAYLSQKGPS